MNHHNGHAKDAMMIVVIIVVVTIIFITVIMTIISFSCTYNSVLTLDIDGNAKDARMIVHHDGHHPHYHQRAAAQSQHPKLG